MPFVTKAAVRLLDQQKQEVFWNTLVSLRAKTIEATFSQRGLGGVMATAIVATTHFG